MESHANVNKVVQVSIFNKMRFILYKDNTVMVIIA